MAGKVSTYTSRQVCEILGLSTATVRHLVAAGFVAPERGRRSEYRFNFRDLILLRTAKGLADAKLAPRRIARSLRMIREKLPAELPLSGLRITATQDAVIVSDGRERWQAHDGQYLLAFEVASPQGQLRVVPAASSPTGTASQNAEYWFGEACRLESEDPQHAIAAYRKALACEACLPGAYANWGRLLHGQGRLEQAQAVYEKGIACCGSDALLLFNLAVLREDQSRPEEAVRLYQAALTADPALADAHYNLGLLYREMGRPQAAVRHLSAYRKHRGRPP